MPTRLVTSKEIIKQTPLEGNVDTDKYIYLIDDVQTIIIEEVLGTKLYDKILVDFAADSLTGHYATIVNDYLKKILVHSVCAEWVSMSNFRVRNAGTVENNPDNATALSKSQLTPIEKNQRYKADTYLERLDKFLCDKGHEIPEYNDSQDNDFDIKPNEQENYVGGWFLRK